MYTIVHEFCYMQVVFGSHQGNGESYHDICDGTLFQTNPVFRENPNALQLIIYYDEFTSVNQISSVSRKYKIGMYIKLISCRVVV